MISSLQNQTIKEAIKLKQKKYRRLNQRYLIEGYHLVKEALSVGIIEKVFIREGKSFDLDTKSVEEVSDKVMDALCETESASDIVAIASMKQKDASSDHICVCYQVQDPGNLGTIMRSALAFGFTKCIFVDCVDYTNAKTIRSSQGALFYLSIEVANSIDEVIHHLHEDAFTIYATSLHNAKPLHTISFDSKAAIIMGNEGQGLPDAVIQQADQNIIIEMNTFESLNVAVAASIVMYTINQQVNQ